MHYLNLSTNTRKITSYNQGNVKNRPKNTIIKIQKIWEGNCLKGGKHNVKTIYPLDGSVLGNTVVPPFFELPRD